MDNLVDLKGSIDNKIVVMKKVISFVFTEINLNIL